MQVAKDVIFYLLIVNLIGKARSILGDPYKILDVHRSAHADEIRRAYKRLVRAYHPDKTSDPKAEDMFVKVTKAYELLMDPDRRNEFDLYGTTEDAPNFRQKRDHKMKLYEFERFSKFPSGSSSPFNPDPNQLFSFLSQKISAKAYQNRILPLSITSPQLILFYDDSCTPCSDVEPVWHKITLELEPLGVGISTMNSEEESTLARKINIPVDLPNIIGIVDGVVRHYRETSLSLSRMIEFIRRILPRKLVTQVNDNNYESFLSGWSDNRVRVLFVNGDKSVKLRYSLTAFHFRERAVCGHVNSKADDSQKLITRYGVDAKMDSMLIFNEDMSRPIASLAATELKPQIIKDILQSNKYLLLPRLTSQVMFDQICPPELARSRRNLCVMLVTNNIPTQEKQLEAMRNFILENELHQEKFRFMYIFQEKQKEFVNSLTVGPNFPKDPASHVVVLWRRDQERLLFEWLTSKWDVSGIETLNRSKSELFELLNKLSKTTHSMTNNAKMVNLIDEQANWFFSRILKRFLALTDGIGDNISTKDFFPVASVVLAFAFIVFIGLIMQQSMKYEESRIREQYRRIGRVPPGLKPKNDCKLNIHELRGETYFGLIRLLKPGCRTIILLCNARTKAKLLPKFYRCVYPYRKNKTLMFAYLLIEKNIDWYKKLLLQNLDHLEDLNINPKNVIGTVLAVNGFKRYFCVYHVKHSEQRRPTEDDFLGFDSQDEEDIEAGAVAVGRPSPELDPSDVVFENNLLDGLPQWLTRLFEGTTYRYGIQYWPDNMK